jgi:hypothetical protein
MQQDYDEVRILSSRLVHTPGIIPYIRNVWRTQPSLAIDLLSAMNAPAWTIPQILSGDYTLEGDEVVIRRNNESKTPLTDLEQIRPGTRRRTR